MLNALFGVRRVLRRVPRTSTRRTAHTVQAPTPLTDRARDGLRAAAIAAHLLPSRESRATQRPDLEPMPALPSRGLLARLGHERACALVVAGVVLGASAVSSLPAPQAPSYAADDAQALTLPLTGAMGGPLGDAAAPRIVVGGTARTGPTGLGGAQDSKLSPTAFRAITPGDIGSVEADQAAAVNGPFLDDGTLLKPVSVNTTVADAKDMIRTYKVKAGDTLAEIGRKHKVSANSIYWANHLKTTKLKAGWRLTIPPVSGLLVTVKPSDTLESLAKKHKIKAEAILKANELDDPNLVMGQLLVMPGAKGGPMVRPPKPKKAVVRSSNGKVVKGGPATYGGGHFAWPTGGGSISRGYFAGHYGLDIAADSGTPVRAAAGGKVLFAGWKSNGGGYQVWISHGSGLYTTYNHMSSLSVGTGQSVGRAQYLGGVGSTGNSTGPHLHFEVWKGAIWNGGTRVNPMAYL